MNTPNYREIEVKYIAEWPNAGPELLAWYLTKYKLKDSQILSAYTKDTYWKTKRGQFVRLRDSTGEYYNKVSTFLKEITVKTKDRATNLNRLEVNVRVQDVAGAKKLLSTLHGKPCGRIVKHELIFFLEDGSVISLCYIKRKLYVEIESPTFSLMNKHRHTLLSQFPMKPESRSLFEIYLENKT